MTHVSKRKLDGSVHNNLEKAFLSLLSELKPNQVKHIVYTLLTPTEKLMIYKRLGILSLTQERLNQEEIAKVLKTTRQTVARIELELFKIPDESKNFVLEKLKKWNQYQKFKKSLKNSAIWATKKVLRAAAGKT